jgi:hypothetical protein
MVDECDFANHTEDKWTVQMEQEIEKVLRSKYV